LALKYSKPIESHEWEILPPVVALLKIFADVVNFCEKENSCISAAVPSAKFIIITFEESDCKGVVEQKEALQQNMNQYFYGGEVRQHFNSIKKKPARCGFNLAGSKIENRIF